VIVISLLVVFLCSCEDHPGEPKGKVNNAMDYYFPIEDLRDTKVYHYKPTNKANQEMYWVLSVHDTLGKTYMITDAYSKDVNGTAWKLEWMKEEITIDSAVVKDYIRYYYDDSRYITPIRATIQSPTTFRKELNKNSSVIWGYSANDPYSASVKEEMKRKRTYTGNSYETNFNNQKVEALVFKDQFIIRQIKNKDEVLSVEDFYQYSYYAKGIGLIKYKRFFDESTYEFTLVDIYSVDNQNVPDLIRNKYDLSD